jgi:ABC-type dipeptide/oligopeptide/nickel transport system permease subunit
MGAMINYARPFLQTRPYLMLFPGLAIVLTIRSKRFHNDSAFSEAATGL